MKIKFLILLALFIVPLTATAQPKGKQPTSRTYTISAPDSSFTVFVAKAGALSSLAHDHNIGIKSFSGKVVIPANGTAGGSMELDVDTTSLVILDNISAKDKNEITNNMNKSVLESSKYPRATFRSVSISNFAQTGNSATFTLNGDLSLHGTTRRIGIPVTLVLEGQRLRAMGQYTLRQTDFGIKPYSAALGTIKVKNEVVIRFNVIAK